jgi:choline kinase
MKAIIIGAGRGRRLMPSTANTPKCFAQVGGRPILGWIVSAFAANRVTKVCFVGGYLIEKVRAAYPEFRFYHNTGWEDNNILASLMCAEEEMDEPFVSCYSDTLFTAEAVERVLASEADQSLLLDTAWLERYKERTMHPPDDAEKATVRNGVVTRVHRGIEPREAHGEFTGMAKFSAAGAAALRAHYHSSEAGKDAKAYLIHLFQEMIEKGVQFAHADTAGGYMEIDTQQDFELARRDWR